MVAEKNCLLKWNKTLICPKNKDIIRLAEPQQKIIGSYEKSVAQHLHFSIYFADTREKKA